MDGLLKVAGARIQRCKALIEMGITRRLRQHLLERRYGFGRHVVRLEQLCLRQCRFDGIADRGGIFLVERGGGLFQLLHHERLLALFFAELTDGGIISQPRLNLLVILQMQRVLRLQFRKFFIEGSGPRQVARLHQGVGQQFVDFVEMRVLAGFDKDAAQKLERPGVL